MDIIQTYSGNNKIYEPFVKKYKQYLKTKGKAIEDDDADDVVTTIDVDQNE